MSSDFPLTQHPEGATPAAGREAPRHPGEAEQKNLEMIRQLTVERDRLRAELDSLRAVQAKTAAALAEVTDERDVYHAELMRRMRHEVTFTDEEVAESIKSAVPIDNLLDELGIDLHAEG